MDLPVKPFRSYVNYAKYLLLYFEPGCNAIIQSLLWLYKEAKPLNEKLLELCKAKKNQIYDTEKKKLESLKKGDCELTDFDLTFLYKIIQKMELLQLKSSTEEVWTQHCPPDQQGDLEYLLFRLKTGRNDLAHPGLKEKDLSDENVDDKCDEVEELLTFILLKAGEIAHVDDKIVQDKIDCIRDHIERIRKGDDKDMNEYLKRNIKKLVLEDLKAKYKAEIDLAFDNELKWYLPPNLYLLREDETEDIDTAFDELKVYSSAYLQLKEASALKISFSDIFTACRDYQVIEVLGAAKIGKSALTKYLFHSWLIGKTDLVNDLDSFDVVLRIECRNVDDRDASKYLESDFTTALYSFSNAVSLKRQLEEFKVLWLMDGFDERTPEFNGLLKNVLKKFPDGHKCLITSRPDGHKELTKDYLSKMKVKTLTLQNLSDSNFQGVLSNWTEQASTVAKFKEFYDSLNFSEKHFLQVPLHMSMFIELWMKNPDDALGLCNPLSLYRKSTDLQLEKLIDRLKERTNFNLHDLTKKVKQWFYGSFCKQIFFMLKKFRYKLEFEDVEDIEDEADRLIPSYCVSSFLTKVEEKNGEARNDFQYFLQRFVFASYFLKFFHKYAKNMSLRNLVLDIKLSSVPELLHFYIGMAVDDNSINLDADNVFDTVREVISTFKWRDQCLLWCYSSVLAKFNENFMMKVAKVFENCSYFDSTLFISFSQLIKFIDYVHPALMKMLDCYEDEERGDFLELVEVLNEKRIPIHIVTNSHYHNETITSIENIDSTFLNITSFTGTLDQLLLLRNHHEKLIYVKLKLSENDIDDLSQLKNFLYSNQSLQNLKIYFNNFLDAQSSPSLFPKDLISKTTLKMNFADHDDFEKCIAFLNKARKGETRRFKVLRYCCDDQLIENYKGALVEHVTSLLEVKPKFLSFDFITTPELKYRLKQIDNEGINGILGQLCSQATNNEDRILHAKRAIKRMMYMSNFE